jgi:hypothetical protein
VHTHYVGYLVGAGLGGFLVFGREHADEGFIGAVFGGVLFVAGGEALVDLGLGLLGGGELLEGGELFG